MTVFAFDPERRTNAEAILDLSDLGYLVDTDLILDPTHGLGNWWKLWVPYQGCIRRHDLDPEKAPDGPMDFTALAYRDGVFDVVAYDPPYKLNGSPTASVDSPYGVHVRATMRQRLSLIEAGLDECVRVTRPGGILLVKHQDQVSSGHVRWQSTDVRLAAARLGCRHEDEIYVSSWRPQPPGRSQVHAARNYSTMAVLRRLPST